MSENLTLRSCVVTPPGYTFLSLDASQIELRVLAILSQDPQMQADLATGDMHLATAVRIAELTGEDMDWLEDELRKKNKRYDAKQVNFATVYGAEEFKIAQMIGGTEDEALELMMLHQQSYPRMYAWKREQLLLARELGYVQNMFGRIRPLPELFDGNYKIREKAEREVVNTIVQGTAVDTVKLCMIYLRERYDASIRLVLQVHDEMLWEIPDPMLEEAKVIAAELEQVSPDYPWSMSVGKVYGDMVKVE